MVIQNSDQTDLILLYDHMIIILSNTITAHDITLLYDHMITILSDAFTAHDITLLYYHMIFILSDAITAHDIEFAVNVMVVADQLLMLRLKQICESLIVSQLTLDNVTQVYQLASTYQTPQLKVNTARL